jgi:ABC-type multidrug transport system fused ATPase/permease subunit
MLWIEKLFQLIPIGRESGSFASFLKVRLIRALCLTFVAFLISVPAWLLMGSKSTTHANDALPLIGLFFFGVMTFLVFIVSGWFQNKWDWFFSWGSHILKMSEAEFGKFRDIREKFVKNSLACLIGTLIIYVMSMPTFLPYMNEQVGSSVLRPAVLLVYLAFFNFFIFLLVVTLLWMIVSMWITFYITLRQPLKINLSPHTNEEFRPLAIWSLKVLFVTFILVTIVVIFTSLGVIIQMGGFYQYLVSLIFLATLGVLAFLLPFYNVHRVLVKLKKQELHEIEEEHDRIIQGLTGTASTQSSDREAINSIISLEVLHIRERRAKNADDWPIGTTILSAMAGLVLIPIVVNIITNLI